MAMVSGIEVELGGVKYVMAPLTLRSIRDLSPELNKVTSSMVATDPSDKIDAVVAVVHASISRNYPDVTKDSLYDTLDIINIPIVISAVMGISGMVQKDGQASGGASENPSTGTSSIGISSPVSQDGLGSI